MSVSVFLDTLRKHDLDQFYPTFSTHGITHLQSLAQLSLQDYSRLGITDTSDRRKIFGLVQAIRKDSELNSTSRANMTPSASTFSGLRQPQQYPAANNINHGRRQSVIGLKQPERPIRSRTMSDAPRPDFIQTKPPSNSNNNSRRLELRRSLYLDQLQQKDEEESSEEESHTKNRKYRLSAPLLDAYGVPLSPAKQAAMMACKSPATSLRYAQSHHQFETNTPQLPPSDLNQKIRVCVRKRPLNKKELDKGDKDMAPISGTRSLQINEPKLKLDLTKYTEQHSFTFDDVFDLTCPNTLVYERTALPLVHYIFKGGKATCFAYGQTGSGKTFTMLDPKHGLYILAARDIFSMLRRPENQHLTAWIGLYEIYQGQLYDLLNERKKLFAREDGKNNVIISGLKEYPIDNVDKLIQVFDYGSSVRSTGSTGANDTSSRSHAVLQILLKHKTNRKKIHGKLSFIDLAGSERGADRGEADTKTRMEGAEINKSLLALKECIRALDQDKRHTPFRQSKLTQVLKDSFVGNSRTCMIATISPGGSCSEHTLNTLRYADRVKELKGERDKKILMERNSSGSGSSYNDNKDDYEDYNDEEEEEEDNLQYDSNDEYFSNESDILDDDTFNINEDENIFNVDFPHEQDALIHHTIPKSPPLYQTGGMVANANTMYRAPPHSATSSAASSYNNNTSEYRPMPRSLSMYSRASVDSEPYSPTTARHGLSYQQMDEFVKFHRAEIREMTDCAKKETKLVANISLDLSQQPSEKESSQKFHQYLQDLDEILEHKLAAIEALRDRISETVGQIEM